MRVRGLKLLGGQQPRAVHPSHPMRVRGLKSVGRVVERGPVDVAPHAGAWIEIPKRSTRRAGPACRTPCGCVD